VRALRRREHGPLCAAIDGREPRGRHRLRLSPQRPVVEPIIGPTCDALAELDPDYLVPTHCAGWRAIHTLAARFPDAYLQASVGSRFAFHSDERPTDTA
jgi:hypothetical protein